MEGVAVISNQQATKQAGNYIPLDLHQTKRSNT